MTKSQGWVLSGSLCGWGDGLMPRFSAAVFLAINPNSGCAKAQARSQRHGDRILPGGDMHKVHTDFMTWAGRYDSAGMEYEQGFASALVTSSALPATATRWSIAHRRPSSARYNGT